MTASSSSPRPSSGRRPGAWGRVLNAVLHDAIDHARRRGRVLRALTLSGAQPQVLLVEARGQLNRLGLFDVDVYTQEGGDPPSLVSVETVADPDR